MQQWGLEMGKTSFNKRAESCYESPERELLDTNPFLLQIAKIDAATSIDSLVGIELSLSDLIGLNNKSLTPKKVRELKAAIRRKTEELIAQKMDTSGAEIKETPLYKLREKNDDNEYTHRAMATLMAIIKEARNNGYAPLIYAALRGKMFYRILRQPDQFCCPSETWRKISSLLNHQGNRGAAMSEMTRQKMGIQ